MYIYIIIYYVSALWNTHAMHCTYHYIPANLPPALQGLVVGAILFRFCSHESHVTRGTCAVAARKMSTGGITWTGCVESLWSCSLTFRNCFQGLCYSVLTSPTNCRMAFSRARWSMVFNLAQGIRMHCGCIRYFIVASRGLLHIYKQKH